MVDFCISGHISNINVSTLRYTYNIIIMVASFAALATTGYLESLVKGSAHL